MTPEKLKIAVAEAKRFLDRAAKVEVISYIDFRDKKHHCLTAGQGALVCAVPPWTSPRLSRISASSSSPSPI